MDAVVLAGNAALRSVLRSMPDSVAREYTRKAFPYRLGREICSLESFETDSDTKEKIITSFNQIMDAVNDAEKSIEENANGRSALLASLVLGSDEIALQDYTESFPDLLSNQLDDLANSLRQKNYGARL